MDNLYFSSTFLDSYGSSQNSAFIQYRSEGYTGHNYPHFHIELSRFSFSVSIDGTQVFDISDSTKESKALKYIPFLQQEPSANKLYSELTQYDEIIITIFLNMVSEEYPNSCINQENEIYFIDQSYIDELPTDWDTSSYLLPLNILDENSDGALFFQQLNMNDINEYIIAISDFDLAADFSNENCYMNLCDNSFVSAHERWVGCEDLYYISGADSVNEVYLNNKTTLFFIDGDIYAEKMNNAGA